MLLSPSIVIDSLRVSSAPSMLGTQFLGILAGTLRTCTLVRLGVTPVTIS